MRCIKYSPIINSSGTRIFKVEKYDSLDEKILQRLCLSELIIDYRKIQSNFNTIRKYDPMSNKKFGRKVF